MSDLRPTHTIITLGGKEYGMLFSLNVIDEIQEHYDMTISEMFNLFKDSRKLYKALRYITTLLINEAIDDEGKGEHVDETMIGRKIKSSNVGEVRNKIIEAFLSGTPITEEAGPNPAGGQTK